MTKTSKADVFGIQLSRPTALTISSALAVAVPTLPTTIPAA